MTGSTKTYKLSWVYITSTGSKQYKSAHYISIDAAKRAKEELVEQKNVTDVKIEKSSL